MLLVFAGFLFMVNLFLPQNHHIDPKNTNLMRFPIVHIVILDILPRLFHVIILQAFITQTTIHHKIQSATQ